MTKGIANVKKAMLLHLHNMPRKVFSWSFRNINWVCVKLCSSLFRFSLSCKSKQSVPPILQTVLLSLVYIERRPWLSSCITQFIKILQHNYVLIVFLLYICTHFFPSFFVFKHEYFYYYYNSTANGKHKDWDDALTVHDTSPDIHVPLLVIGTKQVWPFLGYAQIRAALQAHDFCLVWFWVRGCALIHQAVVRQSSGSRQAVVRQSSESCQAVVRKTSSSYQADIKQSSSSCQAVVNGYF